MITAFAILVGGCLAAPNAHTPKQPSDSANVVAVVAGFHAALVSGDSLAALGFLDRDAIILESGATETRDEYRSHHLQADIEFARAVKSKQSVLRVSLTGSAAWVSSTSISRGQFKHRQISSDGAELIVLRRAESGWKIAAIHWSSRAHRQVPAGRK